MTMATLPSAPTAASPVGPGAFSGAARTASWAPGRRPPRGPRRRRRGRRSGRRSGPGAGCSRTPSASDRDHAAAATPAQIGPAEESRRGPSRRRRAGCAGDGSAARGASGGALAPSTARGVSVARWVSDRCAGRRRPPPRGSGPSARPAGRPARRPRTAPARPRRARPSRRGPRGSARGGAARRPPSAASSAPSTKAGASSRTSEQAGRRTSCSATARSRRLAGAEQGGPKALEAEAEPALDRPERHTGALRDLGLGQAAEVGELDRLALDLGDGVERRDDGLAVEPLLRPRSTCREGSGRRGAWPRSRGARSSGDGAGPRRSPGGGRSRGARCGRSRAHRRTARHCARRPGTLPGRRLRQPCGRR